MSNPPPGVLIVTTRFACLLSSSYIYKCNVSTQTSCDVAFCFILLVFFIYLLVARLRNSYSLITKQSTQLDYCCTWRTREVTLSVWGRLSALQAHARPTAYLGRYVCIQSNPRAAYKQARGLYHSSCAVIKKKWTMHKKF